MDSASKGHWEMLKAGNTIKKLSLKDNTKFFLWIDILHKHFGHLDMYKAVNVQRILSEELSEVWS